MTFELIRNFFMWCAIINYIILILWFGWFVCAYDSMKRLTEIGFRRKFENFDALNYAGITIYKVGIILFNIVPWVALTIMGKQPFETIDMRKYICTLTPNPALDLGGIADKIVPNEKSYVHDEKRYPGGNGINRHAPSLRSPSLEKSLKTPEYHLPRFSTHEQTNDSDGADSSIPCSCL